MNNIIVMKCRQFVLLLIVLFAISNCFSSNTLEQELAQVSQDPKTYVDANQPIVITSEQRQVLTNTFLKKYFSAWDPDLRIHPSDVLEDTRDDFNHYLSDPGFGENTQQITPAYIKQLIQNGNLATFPNFKKPGIVVHPSMVRSMPTLLPSFNDPHLAGQGYPFDRFEDSFIAQGTPVWIHHVSKDGLWYLISSASYSGWIPSQDVGIVSSQFIQRWKNHPFVVASNDNVPLYSPEGHALGGTRIGTLYPKTSEDGKNYHVMVPLLDAHGNAQIKILRLSKNGSIPFPVPISALNIAKMAEPMLGTPYGWGGLYQQRDCSATTSELLAGFGVWLPRNSAQQAKIGKVISLAGKSHDEKLRIISTQGIPFFTIVHFPGHVALYIGTKNGQVYLLQDKWGLVTRNLLGQEGRAVIGKTVITPIDFGKGHLYVKHTLLDTANSISILQ